MSRVKLKICGVQSLDEARQLADLGVDYIGLNFIPTSSRCLSIETAEAITVASSIQTVALFQNQPLELVNDYAARLDIDYVQLHGDESADYARQVAVPVMRAVAPDAAAALVRDFPAAYFVLDRKQQGQGPPVDSELAQQIIAAAPAKVFLAGGLGPDNLAAVLAAVQPYGIDIAGGVRTNDRLDMTKVAECLAIINRT